MARPSVIVGMDAAAGGRAALAVVRRDYAAALDARVAARADQARAVDRIDDLALRAVFGQPVSPDEITDAYQAARKAADVAAFRDLVVTGLKAAVAAVEVAARAAARAE